MTTSCVGGLQATSSRSANGIISIRDTGAIGGLALIIRMCIHQKTFRLPVLGLVCDTERDGSMVAFFFPVIC